MKILLAWVMGEDDRVRWRTNMIEEHFSMMIGCPKLN